MDCIKFRHNRNGVTYLVAIDPHGRFAVPGNTKCCGFGVGILNADEKPLCYKCHKSIGIKV